MDAGSAELFTKAIEEAMRERGHLNVLIAGRSGVGKSTLINAVFQGNMAKTGQGRPVTDNTRAITKKGIPLTIFDTRGLEMAGFEDTLERLKGLLDERRDDPDPNRQIHVAWICIQEDGRRVEEAETALHDMLADRVPLLAVVTKARSDQGFADEVQRLLPRAKNVLRVRALAEEFDDGHSLQTMGIVDLVEATAELLPEGRQRAFAAAQKASVALKKKASHKVVVGASTAAAAAAATPIPMSDTLLLAPIQIGMFAGISACFGLQLSTAFLSTLIASAVGATSATLGGRLLVSNLLKLVPGVGSIVGGMISGAAAATLTATIGQAYIATLAQLFSDAPEDEVPSPETVGEAFKKRMLKAKPSLTDKADSEPKRPWEQ